MKLTVGIYSFVVFLILSGCTNNEPILCADLTNVSGIRFFDENGQAISQVGTPNILESSELKMYPNPSNGQLFISKTFEDEVLLFIVPATKNTECEGDLPFTAALEEVYQKDNTPLGLENQEIQLLLSEKMTTGYYRFLFYRNEEIFKIENVYYDSSLTANETLNFLIGEF